MTASSHPIRILLIETESALSTVVVNVLLTGAALRLFEVKSVPNLKQAFQAIDAGPFDVILLELDPGADPELSPLTRLHQHAPHIPLVALLSDRHQAIALRIREHGAHDYLLESQINGETLPAFLIRLIERHASQKAIRASEERFRMLIENASDVILTLDNAGVIHYASPSTERVLHQRPEKLTGRNLFDFVHRDDRKEFIQHYEKAFAKQVPLSFVQFRFRVATARWSHLEGKGRVVPDAHGRSVCILNSHDVTHRVALESELRTLALRDELTGLHNRRSFLTCFDQEIKEARRRNKENIFLLFIDLDGFKWINDNLGHKTGDKALIEASRLLKSTFREADIVARLGGDEFVVFLTDGIKDGHVDRLTERLLKSVEEWNQRESRPYRLAMSVGVVHCNPRSTKSPETLLKEADALMYKQKQEKKKRRGEAPSSESRVSEPIEL